MASTLNQVEVEFTEAANSWDLEKLYIDLGTAKGRALTLVEKKFLRGLLCGYSPAEIADQVYQSRNSNAVRVYLSNGLYKYIEYLLIQKTGNLIKVKSWNRVMNLLEKAGYKIDISINQSLVELSQKTTDFGTTVTIQDWGEAIDVSFFYGRTEELATLKQWIVKDHCRLIALLGIGGIGKTALSVRNAQRLQEKFDCVIWRSLHHTPSIQDMLSSFIRFLSKGQVDAAPTLASQISQLMDYLRSSRCLLVLDNLETILQSGERTGHYRQGYEGYGELLRRVAETCHQSCLILTSREKPRELIALEGETLPVRTLHLQGLRRREGREIVQAKGNFTGSEDEWATLIDFYGGNPQVLKLAAATIQALFQGDISKFLERRTIVIGDICELLDEQFNRLSELEKKVMYWLAINHGAVSLTNLRGYMVPPVSHSELLEALESIGRRSLLEKNSATFAQKPLIMEYVIKKLIEQVFK